MAFWFTHFYLNFAKKSYKSTHEDYGESYGFYNSGNGEWH